MVRRSSEGKTRMLFGSSWSFEANDISSLVSQGVLPLAIAVERADYIVNILALKVRRTMRSPEVRRLNPLFT